MTFAYVSFPYCIFIVFFKLRMKKTTKELFNVILFSLCCLVLNSLSIILAIIFLDMNQILNQKQPELELFIEKPWRSCPELRAAPKGYAIFAIARVPSSRASVRRSLDQTVVRTDATQGVPWCRGGGDGARAARPVAPTRTQYSCGICR